MSTLLLRLAGPMQSWGTQSRFTIRETEREPTKSGVIGLLCAALGRPRSHALDDLTALRMGVRVDREGTVAVDYQTAQNIVRAHGGGGAMVVSSRYYLADADFLVGLEGDDGLLRRVNDALAEPHWQLFLGRKSMVPGVPIRLPDHAPRGPGLRREGLEETLSSHPLVLPSWDDRPRPAELRLVLDADAADGAELRRDLPLSFQDRTFGIRYVRTTTVSPPTWREDE